MQRDDDVLEENNVFVSQWDSKTTDNTGKDVQKFGSTIEFVGLVDKSKKAFVNSLSNHLSSWDEFGVELMQNVLKVVSFDGFFGIKELEELLHELRSDVYFQGSNLNGFVDDELQKEFIDSLQMWPSWLDFVFGFNSSFRELKVRFLEVR